jgi:murein DD-endopeptidase / murein LD-carboxypeptidase
MLKPIWNGNLLKVKYAFFISLACCITFNSKSQENTVDADSLIEFSKTQLGTNYCYASKEPGKGFDCSGFVYFVFEHFNIKVPRSSREYVSYGTTVPLDSAKKGDVIVFTGTNAKNRRPGHVGIVINNENGLVTFIHSSSGKKKGVIISDFDESPYYRNRFIKIVRIKEVIK